VTRPERPRKIPGRRNLLALVVATPVLLYACAHGRSTVAFLLPAPRPVVFPGDAGPAMTPAQPVDAADPATSDLFADDQTQQCSDHCLEPPMATVDSLPAMLRALKSETTQSSDTGPGVRPCPRAESRSSEINSLERSTESQSSSSSC